MQTMDKSWTLTNWKLQTSQIAKLNAALDATENHRKTANTKWKIQRSDNNTEHYKQLMKTEQQDIYQHLNKQQTATDN